MSLFGEVGISNNFSSVCANPGSISGRGSAPQIARGLAPARMPCTEPIEAQCQRLFAFTLNAVAADFRLRLSGCALSNVKPKIELIIFCYNRHKSFALSPKWSISTSVLYVWLLFYLWFLARDVIYTSRAYATMSVSVALSVCPSICDGSALAHYS